VADFIPRPLWPEGCKPTSLVKLRGNGIGIRLTFESGERMTMPLGQATIEQMFPRFWFRRR
jgi:hypothetical protein